MMRLLKVHSLLSVRCINGKTLALWISIVLVLSSCGISERAVDLPIIGDRTDLDGSKIIHSIRPFTFVSQLGDTITNADVQQKIHVVDFFFTSCPSICPLVTAQMKRIYDHVADDPSILLISHTIDPKRDSVAILKKYADNLDIDHHKWLFLTGDKEDLMEIANEDYFIAALDAPDAPGGFDHSGKIILLDRDAKIRGFCDGTDPASVDRFMKTIDQLRATYEE